MIAVALGAGIAHIWDLVSFLLTVPLVGVEAEIGPIGLVYAHFGAWGAAAWKVAGFAVAALALTVASTRHPRASEIGWLVLLAVGLVGALANSIALSRVLSLLAGGV